MSNLPSPAISEISRMVSMRERAVSYISQGLDHIFSAIEIAPKYSFNLGERACWGVGDKDREKDKLIASLDRQCWLDLIKSTKLAAVLNTKQTAEIHKQVEENAPEFTQSNVTATFMDWFARREDSFRQGLVDLFKILSGNYKSHDAFKVKKRLILQGVVGDFSSCSWGRERFRDFSNYIFVLNGIDPTGVENNKSPDLMLDGIFQREKHEITFDGYRVVAFLNGNIHIWLEEQTINKINQCIADFYGQTLAKRSE